MESIWQRHRTSGHSILPSRRAIFAIFSQSDKYGEQVLASSPNLTLPVMRKIPRPFLTWHFFGTTILPYCCWMSVLVRKCSAPNFRTTRVTLNSTSDFSSSSLFLTRPISPMKTTINKEFVIIWKMYFIQKQINSSRMELNCVYYICSSVTWCEWIYK